MVFVSARVWVLFLCCVYFPAEVCGSEHSVTLLGFRFSLPREDFIEFVGSSNVETKNNNSEKCQLSATRGRRQLRANHSRSALAQTLQLLRLKRLLPKWNNNSSRC